MSTSREIKKTFQKIITSEDQAIGIYETELFWKRRPQDVFQAILNDEIAHEERLVQFIHSRGWDFSKSQQ